MDAVIRMESAWQAKRKTGFRGKVMTGFHRFCSTLDSHQSLLKLLPEGNDYVCLFSGALNAVITVIFPP